MCAGAERIAVDDGPMRLTYAELLHASDAVANEIAPLAPQRDAAVCVLIEHGVEGLVGVLGVMMAGKLAVPLDARDPLERLAFVCREAGAGLVLTPRVSLHAAEVIADGSRVAVLEEMLASPKALDEAGARNRSIDPGTLALLLFTSGSTGTPKGVVRDHDTLVRHGLVVAYANAIGRDDRVGITGSFGFVGPYVRSLGALFGGATASIGQLRRDGLREFAAWVVDRDVTVLQLVPSVLRALTDVAPDARMPNVKLVTLGGETLYGQDVRRARPLFGPHTVFQNRLGATEGASPAVWSVMPGEMPEDGPLPVGTIEPWVEVRVVDDNGVAVPEGEPGLLEVVSDHQGLGYWRDPERTEACFFTLADGRRGFRTSDMVRLRRDGILEHLGRADDRVKVRGAMVSPSEVELALTRLDGVDQAAVKPIPAPDGGTRLAAYVVPSADATPAAWQIRRELATRLPTTMIPAVVVTMDALPTTARGKVDRAALPIPPEPARRSYREPIGRERELAELFAEVLGVEDIGLDDDFFDLGGDSLAVIELLAGIKERFGVELSSDVVLGAPTVADLSSHLVRRRRTASTVVRLRDARSGNTTTPVFCVAGGGSPAVSLRPLANALDGVRPCYAIQARGLEEAARPDLSVEGAARRYVRDMRAVQPRGPYLLAGYSFGGLVAFEMACQLEAAGECVALLAILDTPAPSVMYTRRERLTAGAPPREHGIARRAQWFVRAASRQTRDRLAHALAGVIPRRGAERYDLFYRMASRMTHAYRPASTVAGPVVVMSTSDPRFPDDLGWSSQVRGTVTTVAVPGDHNSMMRRPHVASLGAELSAAIDTSLP